MMPTGDIETQADSVVPDQGKAILPSTLARWKNENTEKALPNFPHKSLTRFRAGLVSLETRGGAHGPELGCTLWTWPLGAPLLNFLCLEILCNKASGVTY